MTVFSHARPSATAGVTAAKRLSSQAASAPGNDGHDISGYQCIGQSRLVFMNSHKHQIERDLLESRLHLHLGFLICGKDEFLEGQTHPEREKISVSS